MGPLLQQICERAAYAPRGNCRVLLGFDQYLQVCQEASALMWVGDGPLTLFGMEVVLDVPHEFCVNCGAPHEPNECSYCKTASTTISFESVH